MTTSPSLINRVTYLIQRLSDPYHTARGERYWYTILPREDDEIVITVEDARKLLKQERASTLRVAPLSRVRYRIVRQETKQEVVK